MSYTLNARIINSPSLNDKLTEAKHNSFIELQSIETTAAAKITKKL